MFASLSGRLEAVLRRFRGAGRVTAADVEAAAAEVRAALLDADVSVDAAGAFLARVRERALGQEVSESLTPGHAVLRVVFEELQGMLGGRSAGMRLQSNPPTVLMLAGLSGSGKTTFAAKLAHHFRSQKKFCLLVACDVDRPAAVLQLTELGRKLYVPVFSLEGRRPPEVAEAALASERAYTSDVVILDTAGRRHVDDAQMAELAEVRRMARPHLVWLVVDAMLGQESARVARAFDVRVGVDGIVLTKLDGDARGGAALSMRDAVGKPIVFVSTGERPEDLEAFHPDRMASRILGMGDVQTLIEKAQRQVDSRQAQAAAQKLRRADFTYEDFLEQIGQVRGIGGLAEMRRHLPGAGGAAATAGAPDEAELSRIEAILRSMTADERSLRVEISGGRRARIARGSGTKVEDVNRCLRQFSEARRMMKSMAGRRHGRPDWLPR